MANTKSAKKNILINARNKKRNQHYKSLVKTVVKGSLAAVASTEIEPAKREAIVKAALKTIDKTASKGIIHKKAAARRKSRLARALNKVTA